MGRRESRAPPGVRPPLLLRCAPRAFHSLQARSSRSAREGQRAGRRRLEAAEDTRTRYFQPTPHSLARPPHHLFCKADASAKHERGRGGVGGGRGRLGGRGGAPRRRRLHAPVHPGPHHTRVGAGAADCGGGGPVGDAARAAPRHPPPRPRRQPLPGGQQHEQLARQQPRLERRRRRRRRPQQRPRQQRRRRPRCQQQQQQRARQRGGHQRGLAPVRLAAPRGLARPALRLHPHRQQRRRLRRRLALLLRPRVPAAAPAQVRRRAARRGQPPSPRRQQLQQRRRRQRRRQLRARRGRARLRRRHCGGPRVQHPVCAGLALAPLPGPAAAAAPRVCGQLRPPAAAGGVGVPRDAVQLHAGRQRGATLALAGARAGQVAAARGGAWGGHRRGPAAAAAPAAAAPGAAGVGGGGAPCGGAGRAAAGPEAGALVRQRLLGGAAAGDAPAAGAAGHAGGASAAAPRGEGQQQRQQHGCGGAARGRRPVATALGPDPGAGGGAGAAGAGGAGVGALSRAAAARARTVLYGTRWRRVGRPPPQAQTPPLSHFPACPPLSHLPFLVRLRATPPAQLCCPAYVHTPLACTWSALAQHDFMLAM